MYCFFLNRR